ncbi:MAG: hypothetical protein EXR35_10635 [Limnohabitans sp.]|nr:hypothetical protein [Limnohabitans sp.]
MAFVDKFKIGFVAVLVGLVTSTAYAEEWTDGMYGEVGLSTSQLKADCDSFKGAKLGILCKSLIISHPQA